MSLVQRMLEPLAAVYDPDKYSNRRLRAQMHQQQVLSGWHPHMATAEPETLTAPPMAATPQNALPIPPLWKKMPTSGWDKLASAGPVYPWNKVGYQDQVSGPPPAQPKIFAQEVEKSRNDCKVCPVVQPDIVPLGCSLVTSDGEDKSVRGRRLVDHWRPFPGYNTPPIGANPVMVTEPNRKIKQGDNFNTTPLFDHYTPDLWKTPYDRSESMLSTGIMVNPWTGTVFETFEKSMPPPTTSKYVIDKEQLKRTNPQLVWLNGGIDPNAPLPSKREVMQDIPGPDGGPNVWGSQLYTEQIGRRLKETVQSQVWNNRNGDFSSEASFPKEAPAGYVGLQPVLRAIPWLPPTQRASMDIKDYTGMPSVTFEDLGGNPIQQHGIVETTRIDLNSSGITRIQGADGFGGQVATAVIPVIDPKPTWRGRTDGWVTAAIGGNADQGNGSYVLQDTTVKDTLKGLNETNFGISAGAPLEQQQTGGYVVTDTTVRDTLKGLQETNFPIMAGAPLQQQQSGGWVMQDTTVRDTLKGLNETNFPTMAGAPLQQQQSGGYVLIDPTVRDTLKGLQETQFPLTSSTALESMPSTGFVITDPTVRDTLKGLNETQFPLTSATALNTMPSTGFVVTDPTVRDTLKGLQEIQFPVMAGPSVEQQSTGGYVLIDPTVKDTLKGLSERTLQPGLASEIDTGSWVPFQGEFRIGARREYYATDVPVTSMHYGTEGSGPGVGPSLVTSRQNRGRDELYWTEPSQIPVEVGTSQTRWIGLQTRDTKTEFGPSVPVANFTQDNSVYLSVPRQYPLVFPSCQRPDDLDDEFLTIRPNYFRET
jgi:hypothetical protein